MKLINHFLFLFLIKSIISENLLDNFSIAPFKNYLKKNGLFEIILSIKKVYGQDVAIISCEELNENCKGNCKRLVIEYMGPSELPELPKPPEDSEPRGDYGSPEPSRESEFHDIVKFPISTKEEDEHKKPDKKLKMPFLDFILSKKFNSEKSEFISNKIKQKIKTRFYN